MKPKTYITYKHILFINENISFIWVEVACISLHFKIVCEQKTDFKEFPRLLGFIFPQQLFI